MEPIDIVITYVNDQDLEWQTQYNYYKNLEIQQGIQKENGQAIHNSRIRDWGTLKYCFRGIEANAPWFRKIFFVVQNEKQIPKWLNTDNPKLRIVYHEEFIPQELLPTFNSNTIELFLCRIPDLSNHYLDCNDDIYFINPFNQKSIFDGRISLPYWQANEKYIYIDDNTISSLWLTTLNNNIRFLESVYGFQIKKRFPIHHIVHICDKQLELEYLNKGYDKIIDAQKTSRFRAMTNVTRHMYDDIARLTKRANRRDELFCNCKYAKINDHLNFKDLATKKIICLNDGELTVYSDDLKNKINKFLNSKLPLPCSFEKEFLEYDKLVSIIIPVYNQEELVLKAIQSIPKNPKIEIIVIDDNSTDNTYKNLCKIPNIILLKNDKNQGAGYSRNRGIDIASGKYIMFLDSDDYMIEAGMNKMFAYMESKENYDVIFYNLRLNDGTIVDITKKNPKACGTIKIIKKDFVGKCRFPLISKGEDKYFHNMIMSKNPKLIHTHIVVEHYNYPRRGSITDRYLSVPFELPDSKVEYLVEATSLYLEKGLKDQELRRTPQEGERWFVSKDRLDKLTWKNEYGQPFVYIIEERLKTTKK